MELTGRLARQLLLVSLLLMLMPLVLFPERLGTELARVSLLNAVWELLYYGIVAVFLIPQATLLRIVQAAGLCLIYRLGLGAVFGLFVAAFYSKSLDMSLTLGLSSYLPAILLHAAVAPFALRPLYVQGSVPRRRPLSETPAMSPQATAIPAETFDRSRGFRPVRDDVPAKAGTVARPMAGAATTRDKLPQRSSEPNGFDVAARHVGADAAVRAVLVVDNEGLLLGQFNRSEIVAEDLAPFALLIENANRAQLARAGWAGPNTVDLEVDHFRLVIAKGDSWRLMVVTERQGADTVRIRIGQGLDMIRKYVEQRYRQALSQDTEKSYVPSAR